MLLVPPIFRVEHIFQLLQPVPPFPPLLLLQVMGYLSDGGKDGNKMTLFSTAKKKLNMSLFLCATSNSNLFCSDVTETGIRKKTMRTQTALQISKDFNA